MGDTDFSEVIAAMRDQWVSMVGMAAMFTTSILIGVFIQPRYNFEVYRAFGEEGTTEVSNIFIELGLILIFTFVIIWLARRGKEALIKAFILFALWYSLVICVEPFFLLIAYFAGINSTVAWVATLVWCVGVMVILHKFPEWYVVNAVGVLVGAGVITMIGIAFVPVLIIFFMILAAIYDHWAVNKSKHMLELADTMIGLKLPVLLVAPKNTSYTFLEQEADVMRKDASEELVPSSEPSDRNKSKGRDALFMGLGDVIFPGMLVISSITFLPDAGPVVFDFWGDPAKPISLGPMLVGMGTLVGGLLGYIALMTQVARGKPQAGLPLLNGGSILGYLVSGAIALGVDRLWQDISFL